MIKEVINGRVLIAAANLGEFGETDGVVTTYQNLIPCFVRSGQKADFLAYGKEDKIEENGPVRIIIRKPRWPVKIDPSRWIDMSLSLFNSYRDVLEENYALVQSSTPCPMGLLVYKIARRSKCPFISVYHTALDKYVEIRVTKKVGSPLGKVSGSLMNGWLQWFNKRADMVLTPSHYVKGQVERFTDSRVEVLSRGVDPDMFSPEHRTRQDGKPRAIYVGRVAHEKDLQLLVDIFSREDKAELMVVGDGPFLEPMKEALPKGIFTGRLVGEDLRRAYADADFFVFPSKTDTLGNVVLEGMSSGLPAVVTDVMGPKELVEDGVTGFVTHSNKEFTEAVGALINDPERRREMSRAARESVKARTWEAIFERLAGYYRELLQGHEISMTAKKN